jgi:hypothetical protein
MTPAVSFRGKDRQCSSVEELSAALQEFDAFSRFELWLNQPDGPALCMLRNGEDAWPMYLRHPGDPGFNSIGDRQRQGMVAYELGNGQADEYPAAWCVPVEDCYKTVEFFFAHEGLRPDWLEWQEN